MFRALVVLRVLLTLNLVGLNLYRGFEHRVGGWLLVAVLVVWTAVVSWALAAAARRTPGWLLADLVVALAAIVLTPAVKGADFSATVPGYWVMGAMLAWSIHWRWRGGLVAAVLLSVTDVATRPDLSASVYGNVFLLLVGGPVVGLMVDSLARSAVAVAAAERAAAAAAERTRLARAVHDGVLQVLALVQRRGPELGLAGAELGSQLTDNFRNTGYFNNTATSVLAPFANPTISTPVTFSQTSNPAPQSSQWDFGDGTTSQDPSPSHSYAANGSYIVTVTDQYASCTTTATKTIQVGSAATPAFTANNRVSCSAPFTVQFTDQTLPVPSQWLWDFGDGQTSTDQHPVHTYTTTGIFDVKLTTTSGGCAGTTVQSAYIKVQPPVINSLGGTLGACINTTPDHTAVTPLATEASSWSPPASSNSKKVRQRAVSRGSRSEPRP